ncbi:MAG: TetR/AcrR family transcriptional regulator [Pseudomonadota bacterium]|nr:TetR/AcrR family transcriptional regulator [Pseudomonadota bacterium]
MTRHLSEGERRAQIMRAARAIFIERGYLAARVEDVAKRANLSKGAVYFYFESKRAIFDALVDEEHAITISFLEEADRDTRPAAIKLVELGRKYLDYFAGLKTPPRFFLLMSEMAIRDEDVRKRVNATHQRFVNRIAAVVEQGMREGVFEAYDPMAVGLVLKALIDGLAGQSAVGVRPDVERLSTDGVRLILQGLLPKSIVEAQANAS